VPAQRFGFSGTAPVLRAETIRHLGGFAVRFFAYNEDTDWCLRAHLAGYRIVYDPHATVTHRLSATSGGTADARVRYLAVRNHLLCLVRNAPLDVAAHHVWERGLRSPDPVVRRGVVRTLPWAAASRLVLRRRWVTTPRAVWDRWAGADLTWDDGPSRQ